MYSYQNSKLNEVNNSLSWVAARSSMAITRFRLGEEIDEADLEAAKEMLDALDALKKVAEIKAENLLTNGNFPDGYTLGLRTLSALKRTEAGKTVKVTQLVNSVRPVLRVLCGAKSKKSRPSAAELDKAALAAANFSEELSGSDFVYDPAIQDGQL